MAELPENIDAELDDIKKTVQEIILLNQNKDLNKHEVNSAAFMLQNFYNGIENVIKQVFKLFNLPIPSSSDWHKELLITAYEEKIFSKKLNEELMKYLRFRHFSIHNYVFHLKLELFKDLIENIEIIYNKFEKELYKIFK